MEIVNILKDFVVVRGAEELAQRQRRVEALDAVADKVAVLRLALVAALIIIRPRGAQRRLQRFRFLAPGI